MQGADPFCGMEDVFSSGSNKSWHDDSDDENRANQSDQRGYLEKQITPTQEDARPKESPGGGWGVPSSVSPAAFLGGLSPGLGPTAPMDDGLLSDNSYFQKQPGDWHLTPQNTRGGVLSNSEQQQAQTKTEDEDEMHGGGGGDPRDRSTESEAAANSNQVLLFDEAGSTYLCMLGERNEQIEEYYRVDPQSSWQLVQRSDTACSQAHLEAGVPKSINWTGPALIVYTQGKQEIGKGGVLNKPTRKYYQWCRTCCTISCGSAMPGCTKAKCWVAPRKWKKHCRSQTHITAGNKLQEGAMRSGMAVGGYAPYAGAGPLFGMPPRPWGGGGVEGGWGEAGKGMMGEGGMQAGVYYPRGVGGMHGGFPGMQPGMMHAPLPQYSFPGHGMPPAMHQHPAHQHAATHPPPPPFGYGGRGQLMFSGRHAASEAQSHARDPRNSQAAPLQSQQPPRSMGMEGPGCQQGDMQGPAGPEGLPGQTGAETLGGGGAGGGMGVRGSLGWHSKLQQLQRENTNLRDRVESLNTIVKTMVREEPSEGEARDGLLSMVESVEQDELAAVEGLGGRDGAGKSVQAGKRDLVAVDDCPPAPEGEGGQEVAAAPDSKRARVGTSQQKEVLLVFDGDLSTCDRDAISGKLRRLRRLLAKRFESKQSSMPDGAAAAAAQLLTRILVMAPGTPMPLPEERIRVMVENRLRGEILGVCAFVADLHLSEEHIRFMSLEPDDGALADMEDFGDPSSRRSGKVQVVVVGFNYGREGEQRVDEGALSELCQPESVSWALCGSCLSIGWVQRECQPSAAAPSDAPAEDRCGHLVVCNAERQASRLTMYYPPQLAPFFSDASLHKAFEPQGFLGKELARDVGAIQFLEWMQGSVRVPCRMPPWLAHHLWNLFRSGDEELVSCMTQGPHNLCAVEMDGWAIQGSAAATDGPSQGPEMSEEDSRVGDDATDPDKPGGAPLLGCHSQEHARCRLPDPPLSSCEA